MRPSLLLLLVACGKGGDPATDSASTDPTPPLPPIADAGYDVVGLVGESLSFDGSGSEGVRFVWDFGDGTTAEGIAVEHAYSSVGNRTAVLQVFGEDGSFKTDAILAVAHGPLTRRAQSASTLAHAGGDAVWAVDREGGHLARVSEAGSDRFEVCSDPRTVAAGAFGGNVAVTCPPDRLLEVGANGEITDTVNLPDGAGPYGVVSDGVEWIVGLQGRGEIATVSSSTLVDLVAVDDVRGLVVGTGVYAARYRSVDGVGRIYGDHEIVLPFDPGPDSDTTIRGVPNGLEHLALSPDGRWLYASGTLGNTARGLFRDGETPTFETSVRAFVDAVDPVTGDPRWRKQFDDHGMAGPMALSELGNWLFVGFPTTRDVLILDAWSGDIVSSILDAGLGIRGLVVEGDRLYVHAWLDREVRAYDLSDLGNPSLAWVQSTGPESLAPEVLEGKRVFWDATDTRMAKAGYLSCAVCHPDGEHDGLTWDFTDRGEGLRNTSSLLGRGGTAMGPLHWTANFDEVQDFEHDIRGAFGGSGFLAEADWTSGTVGTTLGDPKAGLSAELDALAAYVTSLDTPPVSPFRGDGDGAAMFVDLGCPSCHVPPLYTDSPTGVRHDVGTLSAGSGQRLGGPLDGLDTPTLLGAWQTGPWLHDGSASTLAEAIGAHDSAAALPANELEILADYVKSL